MTQKPTTITSFLKNIGKPKHEFSCEAAMRNPTIKTRCRHLCCRLLSAMFVSN